MARKKTPRKEEFTSLPNAFKHASSQKGKWKQWFGNDHPLVLEIGCGKGDFSIGLAKAFPEKNFSGLDLKSDRLWVAATRAAEQGLKNICFHRLDARQISEFYDKGEVDEIWITFPDPFPKKRHTPRRLTHVTYLNSFREILKPGGLLHFKTDNQELFSWTLEHFQEIGQPVLESTRDLHHSALRNEENSVLTAYERKFIEMGKTTFYLKCIPPLDGFKKTPKEIEEKNLEDFLDGGEQE